MHDIFFFTDIHGARPLFDAIMNYCHEQDDEATIIFGGDAIDRGPDGYQIMKELLDNPKVVYLKGNHEDMFVKAARNIKEMFSFKNANVEHIHKLLKACMNFDYKYAAIQDSLYNGGLSTLTDWILDGMPDDIVDRIDCLPLTCTYEMCDFCHAAGIYKTFERVADAEYEFLPPDEFAVESLLWTRSSFNQGWEPGRTAVFGHTPVQYLYDYMDNVPKDLTKPYKWNISSSTKIDMDTGAVFTGVAYVLNVLTMNAQGFENRENEIKKIDCIQM